MQSTLKNMQTIKEIKPLNQKPAIVLKKLKGEFFLG